MLLHSTTPESRPIETCRSAAIVQPRATIAPSAKDSTPPGRASEIVQSPISTSCPSTMRAPGGATQRTPLPKRIRLPTSTPA